MKRVRFCDVTVFVCLCAAVFCLPFAKAGIEIFVWGGFLAWFLKRIFGYRTDGPWGFLPRTPLNTMLLAFLVANVIATVLSVHFGLSLKALFGKLLKYLIIFFMVAETVNTEKRLKGFLLVLLGSAFLLGADAAVQYVRGIDFLRGVRLGRVTASFANPNDFAGWLAVIVLIFGGVLGAGKDGLFRKRVKVFFAVALVVSLAWLLITYSRGAWLGVLAGSLLGAVCIFRGMGAGKKGLSILLAVLMLTGLFVFAGRAVSALDRAGNFQMKFGLTLGERIRSIPDSRAMTTAIRFNLWKEALVVWKRAPLTGSGLNTYARVSPKNGTFAESGVYPHNCYLQMAAETGLLGLGSFLWFLVAFFQAGLRYWERCRDFLLLGLMCGILAFLVHSFVDSNLYQLQLAVLFWFMLGLAVAVMRLGTGAGGCTAPKGVA